mmetsp:Transcript_26796/g.58120  ORF Transcript_26796/g.58120 Transcript_26796/m.58120 type:complete len:251 (-) Transcript_26796:175-927(-)
MTSEDEFSKRDASGLQPTFPKGAKSASQAEAQTRAAYYKLTGIFQFGIAPALAFGLLSVTRTPSSTLSDQYEHRLAFIRKHDLGWIYAAWYVLSLARTHALINANATRAGARVGRPDQHAYKIMARPKDEASASSTSKDSSSCLGLADAPYVLMENVGPVGRFNRAQRAAFHFDEGLELLLGSIFLVGAVLPRLAFGLVVLYCLGRVLYTGGYTESLNGRMNAFALVAIPAVILSALVGIFGIQTLYIEQ